jgi:outer membrane protein assembly factor BamE (lipoprotein component of BamABCDE complex)
MRRLFRPYWCFLLFLIMLLTGCSSGTDELEQAGRSYRTQQDYTSLEILSGQLRKGMTRSKVEELLGEADYSPIAGQEYYSSDRREAAGSGKEQLTQITMPVGLVVDYRDEQGQLTGQVQRFWLGRIGE